MRNTVKYFAGLLLFGAVLVTGCSEEDGITPGEITDLTADTTPGCITLHWNIPEEANIRYVEVNYYDPLLKKDVMRTASVYANSVEIPDTRRKYGEYKFEVRTVSPTGDKSAVQAITQVSEAALTTYVDTPIALRATDLSTNAQEPSEGSIANLLDGNTSTYFHTAWSVDMPGPHWLQANLRQEITEHYKFYFAPRNASNRPTDFDLMGSTDGNDWFLIKNFTKEGDGLPVGSEGAYTSPVLDVDKPFSQIRIVVNETSTGSVFWTMSEFKFYSVSIVDPEAADE
ncbi:MAG: discoidin domain-containing protein [Bacteroides sp.]|nr:discoidin domain-containing protein [Bacteroides sp.]